MYHPVKIMFTGVSHRHKSPVSILSTCPSDLRRSPVVSLPPPSRDCALSGVSSRRCGWGILGPPSSARPTGVRSSYHTTRSHNRPLPFPVPTHRATPPSVPSRRDPSLTPGPISPPPLGPGMCTLSWFTESFRGLSPTSPSEGPRSTRPPSSQGLPGARRVPGVWSPLPTRDS